ncbi:MULTISPECIES: hypothetical protein [unclassified Streptomyces]|nr:hypothetical protein [Streptomyces sp. NBC_01268]
MSNTDAQESNGSGRHRGESAPSEDATSSSPHGRHRREPDA